MQPGRAAAMQIDPAPLRIRAEQGRYSDRWIIFDTNDTVGYDPPRRVIVTECASVFEACAWLAELRRITAKRRALIAANLARPA